MFNFKEITYISRDLMCNKEISMKAKYMFSIIDEEAYKKNSKTVEIRNDKMLADMKIKSTATLSKVKKELIDSNFIEIKVEKNKIYYTLKKSYLRGDF